MKGKAAKLYINKDVKPLAQKHRRVPFNLRDQVEAEIRKLEELDIIEKAEGPTPWVSPIVIVPKKTGIRICVDMRAANEAIDRERHPVPTIEDLIVDLNGSTVFSKIDLNQGYHQLELDDDSRSITTFATHLGLYRYKRLSFGINSASEIFQKAVEEVLQGISGARNISDDIIVFGKNQHDHDTALQAVFQRMRDYNLTANPDKCLLISLQLTFLVIVLQLKVLVLIKAKLNHFLMLVLQRMQMKQEAFWAWLNICQDSLRTLHQFQLLFVNLRARMQNGYGGHHNSKRLIL